MAIVKSSALHDWLLGLNFTIFTWQLNIGDWIETAIDWTVSWVNEAYNLAEAALNWGISAWDRAGDLYQDAISYIHTYTRSLFASMDTMGDYLSSWWSARRDEVRDLVDAAVDAMGSVITSVNTTVNTALAAWDNFYSSTLPQLLDLDRFRSWWGFSDITFGTWWTAARAGIVAEITAQLQPLLDQVTGAAGVISLARELFADPEQWLYNRLDSFLERFW